MNDPFFTVAVPAYNAAKTIAATLDSVAAQTFSDYEIVVTDDGSRDDTAAIVEQWKGRHPTITLCVVSQANKGIGAARNGCINAARGTYVAFLDADDEWLPQKLEAVATQFLGEHPPDVLSHDQWWDSREGRRRVRCGPYTSQRDLLFRGNCLFTSATTVRRGALVATGGFSENLDYNGVEDWELWIRLAASGARFEYLHEPLGIYRSTEAGISGNIDEQCRHTVNVFERHFAAWEPKNFSFRCRRRGNRSSLFRWAGNARRRQGRFDESRRYLRQAIREDPLNWKAWLLLARVTWG